MNNKSAVILVFGGMDSATAVYEAIEQGYEPYLLHTSYEQRTEDKEYECAKALAEELMRLTSSISKRGISPKSARRA